jgi:Delta24-sterol reductase
MEENKKQHISDLKNIQEKVRMFYSQEKRIKIYRGSTHSTRSLQYDKDKVVDISKFDRILEINTDEKYVLVEPNVSMDRLVEETLKQGLVPPVVMELPAITVGGGVQGGAGESSSFKYGLFHDCCLEYEIVLGNGDVIITSPQKSPDLFFGTACSYGSLGIITLVKLRLIPAKNFIHLTYHIVKSFEEMVDSIKKKTNEAVCFVDGIMFSKNSGVVMVGNFSDKQNLPISTFCKASDEWFYLHVKKIVKNQKKYEEIIPIKDYFFRYDRGGFWMGRHGFSIFKIPFIRFFRFILNKFFKTKILYRFFHAANLSQRYFMQDINLPIKNVLKFLEFIDNNLQIYPLWFCPLRPGEHDKLSPNCINADLVVNIGIWGDTNKDFSHFIKLNRDLEAMTIELNARKVLYAHAYYPRDEFWKIYDLDWYNSLRNKYHASVVFSDIYDTTFVSEKYKKPSILSGLWSVIK